MHGISHLSFNSQEEGSLINRIGNLPLISFWKKRVEKTYNTYRKYSEKRINWNNPKFKNFDSTINSAKQDIFSFIIGYAKEKKSLKIFQDLWSASLE